MGKTNHTHKNLGLTMGKANHTHKNLGLTMGKANHTHKNLGLGWVVTGNQLGSQQCQKNLMMAWIWKDVAYN